MSRYLSALRDGEREASIGVERGKYMVYRGRHRERVREGQVYGI